MSCDKQSLLSILHEPSGLSQTFDFIMLGQVAGVVITIFLLGVNSQVPITVTGNKFKQITIKEESWTGVKTGGNRSSWIVDC